jgi:hypothetical protein
MASRDEPEAEERTRRRSGARWFPFFAERYNTFSYHSDTEMILKTG